MELKSRINNLKNNIIMYDERIEQLINAALADGVLTEKEKQILFKRAQEQGIDLDEFEMVLDARLVELQKVEKEKAEKSAPKSNKLGDVRKCPQCGAVIGSFVMICPDCGFEFSNIGPNKFVETFSNKLQNALADVSVEPDRSLLGRFNDNPQTREILKNQALAKAETQLVKNYPLPMTKEDCVEMLNYILPKILEITPTTRAYRTKYEAILHKMEFENRENTKILELVNSYREQGKLSGFKKFMVWFKSLSQIAKIGLFLGFFYAIFGLIGLIGLFCL